MCLIVLIILISVYFCKVVRKNNETRDENPVYDMYYFADGDRIDYGNVEVEGENQMYGT